MPRVPTQPCHASPNAPSSSPPTHVYELDRDVNKYSRKCIQHHLCSLAIHDMLGSYGVWTLMTYGELKAALSIQKQQRGGGDGEGGKKIKKRIMTEEC